MTYHRHSDIMQLIRVFEVYQTINFLLK